jgi:hypothetical protein
MGHPETSDFDPGEYRRAPIAFGAELLAAFRGMGFSKPLSPQTLSADPQQLTAFHRV